MCVHRFMLVCVHVMCCIITHVVCHYVCLTNSVCDYLYQILSQNFCCNEKKKLILESYIWDNINSIFLKVSAYWYLFYSQEEKSHIFLIKINHLFTWKFPFWTPLIYFVKFGITTSAFYTSPSQALVCVRIIWVLLKHRFLRSMSRDWITNPRWG